MLHLDHLVYAVPDLEAAIVWFEEKTGIRPAIGGRHPSRGTRNAVVDLGEGAYLEIVAADPENTSVPPPRWMGVDYSTRPEFTRWALKSDDLRQAAERLKALRPGLGQIVSGNRTLTDGKALSWQMTLPAAEPAVELLPFFLDWSDSEFHPTERMGEGYRLVSLQLSHPEEHTVKKQLEQLGVTMDVDHAAEPRITVELATPRGRLKL